MSFCYTPCTLLRDFVGGTVNFRAPSLHLQWGVYNGSERIIFRYPDPSHRKIRCPLCGASNYSKIFDRIQCIVKSRWTTHLHIQFCASWEVWKAWLAWAWTEPKIDLAKENWWLFQMHLANSLLLSTKLPKNGVDATMRPKLEKKDYWCLV